MKQVFIKKGQAVVEDIPAPILQVGCVLVQVAHSCISAGTELGGIKDTAAPLWKRAIEDPQRIAKAVQMVARRGFAYTLDAATGRFSMGSEVGYSLAGIVVAVAADVEGFRIGDRVACAGAQFAHHAEVVCVPKNLVVPIPDGVSLEAASTVALGSIAMQGVRRAMPTLGETFVVIGLGLLGQLTTQMLLVNGCRVIGSDLDPKRSRLAQELGVSLILRPDDTPSIEQSLRLTQGMGVDGVLITASSSSDEIVSTAFQLCRRKGRVVLVGDVGLDLNREDFYRKELDFFISTSYGPGRYDDHYELEGWDYPLGYVRWTENRNMSEYLSQIEEGKLQLDPLINGVFAVDEATAAYESLQKPEDRPLIVLLSYPHAAQSVDQHRVSHSSHSTVGWDKLRLAIIGASGFNAGMHVPNLKALSDLYSLDVVMSRSGNNAVALAKSLGSRYSTTDYQEVLNDPDIDAVLIGTRHNTHAEMTLQALRAGKHVLVEKPLALTHEEMESIQTFYASDSSLPQLLTGFNRRFSPHAQRIKAIVQQRSHPMILRYRMNAGYIPLNHWIQTAEGGGRNLGEACHIYDLFTYLTDSKVVKVEAQAIRVNSGYYTDTDNFVATLTFADGSVATLTYTALGAKSYAKEHLEVYVDGKILELDDYSVTRIHGATMKGVETKEADKGHRQEVESFARSILQDGEWAIPLWQQLQTTDIALQVENIIKP